MLYKNSILILTDQGRKGVPLETVRLKIGDVDFTDLDFLKNYKVIYLEHLIIKWRGADLYKVQNSLNGESPIFIRTLNLTLLFVISNYHLSKF